MNRKSLKALLALGLLLSCAGGMASINNQNSSLAMNLTAPVRYGMDMPFIDELKRAEVFTQSPGNWNTNELDKVQFDDSGWPMSLSPLPGSAAQFDRVSFLLFSGDYDNWDVPSPRSGIFRVTWEGDGEIGYSLQARKVGDCGSRCELVEITPKPAAGALISITATDPAGNGNYLRNLRVLHPGGTCNGVPTTWVADETACPGSFTPLYAQADQLIFHPEYLRELVSYASFRFMDSTFTNYMPIPGWSSREEYLALPLRQWARRPKLSDSVWSSEERGGLPIEVMVSLSNRLDASPWFTLHPLVDDNYVNQFASLVKQQLEAGLDVYLEYGNEIWNGAFGAGNWVHYKGQEYWPDEGDGWAARANFFAKRSVEVCQQWKTAWGNEAGRVHCVMGAQSAGDWVTENRLLPCPLWIGDERNPDQTMATCGEKMDAVAIAPYFGHYVGEGSNLQSLVQWNSMGAAGLDLLFEELTQGGKLDNSPTGGAVASIIGEVTRHKAVADRYGISLLAYEGGQHLAATGSAFGNADVGNLFKRANRDRRMQDIYTDYLKSWRVEGGELFTLYNAVGPSTPYGSWGIREYQGQPPTPKQMGAAGFMAFSACWWSGCSSSLPAVDSDLDGELDTADNCSAVSNAGLRDSNGDGYGNLCDTDLTDNAVTDFDDLTVLKAAMFGQNSHADFDGDGRVDFRDLAHMKRYFRQAPGPSYVDGG